MNILWEKFANAMSEDYKNRGFSEAESRVFAYFDVADRMALLGKDFALMVPQPVDERPEVPEVPVDYDFHAQQGAAKLVSQTAHSA